MIILTDCLGNTADEGGMKVCSSLARRLKAADASVTVISFGEQAGASDVHIPANKFLLNWRLMRQLRQQKEPVLYLPSYARMLPMAGRILMLTMLAGRRVRALIVMRPPSNMLGELLLKWSGAEVLCLSAASEAAFAAVVGERACQIRTGVDTDRFVPVPEQRKPELRRKYGLPVDKPVVLHVGHMKAGRGVGVMEGLDSRFHGALVVSSLTAAFEDKALRECLSKRDNLTIIDEYVPCIEEIYQASDVYLFPVEKERNCIDVPLSVLEAAACGIPVVATEFGELKGLLGQEGFYRLDCLDADGMNACLDKALREGGNPRPQVLPYDWKNAVAQLLR